MKDKIRAILAKYHELEEKLQDPVIAQDYKAFSALSREKKQLDEVAKAGQQWVDELQELEDSRAMLNDPDLDSEMKDLAREEVETLKSAVATGEEELKVLLLPRDENDVRNCVFELRAGTGGDEACLFVGDLLRMYQRFAEQKSWKMDIIDLTESERGGFKEVVCALNGENAFGAMKYESGVHRVQRVPETEASGRIHTSAATVAVMPEAEDVDIEIRQEDLRIDVFRSGGKGGQNVNKLETAVRITHAPSGIVVQCQDERSQLKNKDKAMKVLRARLYEQEQEKREAEQASSRKNLVGSGDRSDKIRTYNYPQNRVTDHRLEGDAKNYPLKEIIEGDLSTLVDNLRLAETAELMRRGETL